MSEIPIGSPNQGRLLSEARMLALAEPQPGVRLELLEALISEGDRGVTNFAIAALRGQPDTDEEGVSTNKVTSAQTLVDTLADQQLFDDAERVVSILERLDMETAIDCMSYLLGKGYAGEENRYLRLDFTPLVEAAHTEGRPPREVVFNYIYGLAAYGVDLLDRRVPAGKLLTDSLSAVIDPVKRDYYYNSVAYSFASGDHIDKAVATKDLIGDSYWRSLASIQIAKVAQEHGDRSLADVLLNEARGLLVIVGNCDSSCGRMGCNPALDIREIEIGMALVLAKEGELAQARELVGAIEPAFAYDQALVNAEIYRTSGDISARTAALAALKDSSIFQRKALAGKLIAGIGAADRHWGNIMPSLNDDAGNESIPLICWELHDLYAERHRLERKLETGYRVMELLGIDPLIPLGDIAERRGELRDHGLSALVKLLSVTGAPKTARDLVDLIKTPVEKVRAMAAMGRAIVNP